MIHDALTDREEKEKEEEKEEKEEEEGRTFWFVSR